MDPRGRAPGPYFYGSRRVYLPGEELLTDVVSNLDGEEDERQMRFATTSEEQALKWAHGRGIPHGGDTLNVYELDMRSPAVDGNARRQGVPQDITSVMSPHERR